MLLLTHRNVPKVFHSKRRGRVNDSDAKADAARTGPFTSRSVASPSTDAAKVSTVTCTETAGLAAVRCGAKRCGAEAHCAMRASATALCHTAECAALATGRFGSGAAVAPTARVLTDRIE